MRKVAIAVLTALLVSVPMIIADNSDAARPEDAPTAPVVLCYYTDGINLVNTYYALPGVAIGTQNIPELTGAINYWVRMDTGKVVKADTIFEPGTYMIKGYTTPPVPWGPEPEPSQGGGNSIDMGLAIGMGAVILGTVCIGVVAMILLRDRK